MIGCCCDLITAPIRACRSWMKKLKTIHLSLFLSLKRKSDFFGSLQLRRHLNSSESTIHLFLFRKEINNPHSTTVPKPFLVVNAFFLFLFLSDTIYICASFSRAVWYDAPDHGDIFSSVVSIAVLVDFFIAHKVK